MEQIDIMIYPWVHATSAARSAPSWTERKGNTERGQDAPLESIWRIQVKAVNEGSRETDYEAEGNFIFLFLYEMEELEHLYVIYFRAE